MGAKARDVTNPWGPAPLDQYGRLDLFAHELLCDVPLHDVWQVELPGGGPGRSIADVRALFAFDSLANLNASVRFLFALRGWLGGIFRWDRAEASPTEASFLSRVPPSVLEASTEPPGSRDGPFELLYALEHEAVSEVHNATVHAFSVMAVEVVEGGYRAFWAIYVAPVGRFTPYYMRIIDPFRRYLIYPAILRHAHRTWQRSLAMDPAKVRT